MLIIYLVGREAEVLSSTKVLIFFSPKFVYDNRVEIHPYTYTDTYSAKTFKGPQKGFKHFVGNPPHNGLQ